MKKIYITLITLIGCLTSYAQIVAIPDTNFKKALLSQGLDKNKNGEIDNSEVYSLIRLDVSNKNITDLTGIEKFVELFQLNCSNNAITSINLSKNYLLTELNISSNKLSALNLSKVPQMSNLNCSDNLLDTLDLSYTSSITMLNCSKNQLEYLDVSKLNLYQFDCSFNKIGTLNLQKSTNLYSALLSSNILAGTLDVSNSTDLTNLACDYNQLSTLVLPNTATLQTLRCNNNKLTALDVENKINLTLLTCNSNQIISLQVAQLAKLQNLTCQFNKLKELDLSGATELQILYCNNNQITQLDVSQNTKISLLFCLSNKLTSLDVTHQTNLTQLNASGNLGLSYICVKDAALATTNTKYVKDATTQWTEDCNVITATDDKSFSSQISLSPNPSHGTFSLNLNDVADVTISTLEGKPLNEYAQLKDIQFGTDYKPGVYIVQVKSAQGSTALRVVKE